MAINWYKVLWSTSTYFTLLIPHCHRCSFRFLDYTTKVHVRRHWRRPYVCSHASSLLLILTRERVVWESRHTTLSLMHFSWLHHVSRLHVGSNMVTWCHLSSSTVVNVMRPITVKQRLLCLIDWCIKVMNKYRCREWCLGVCSVCRWDDLWMRNYNLILIKELLVYLTDTFIKETHAQKQNILYKASGLFGSSLQQSHYLLDTFTTFPL